MPGDATSAADELAARVAREMFAKDAASRSLGIEILVARAGYTKVSMVVRADMLNGHGIGHGGFVFAMADSAFAFCCNSFNDVAVAAGVTIDFLAPVRQGERLIAVAVPVWRAKRTGIYDVAVTREDGSPVAAFRGRSHQLNGNVIVAET